MKTTHRWLPTLAATLIISSTLAGPLIGEAQASKKGRLNTVIGAGAVTAYGLLKGNKTLAILGGLGTAYAYKRYRDAVKSERRHTIGQVFGSIPVYDSRHHRYSRSSRFYRNRTYYNARGHAIG
jgi:hypothetical protein